MSVLKYYRDNKNFKHILSDSEDLAEFVTDEDYIPEPPKFEEVQKDYLGFLVPDKTVRKILKGLL